MSRRRDLRDQLLTKLQALDLGGATVGLWKGEPQAFNSRDPVFPLVSLAYAGSQPGPNFTKPGPYWDRYFDFAVLVETSDDTAPDGDGEGHALDLLELVERGLHGFRPEAKIEVRVTGEEEQIGAELGRYLYGQGYRVLGLIVKNP